MYVVYIDKPTNMARVHLASCIDYRERQVATRPGNWWVEAVR